MVAMGGFHPMPYPCKQGMKPTLSLLKSHSAFALHSCPLLLSPRHSYTTMCRVDFKSGIFVESKSGMALGHSGFAFRSFSPSDCC